VTSARKVLRSLPSPGAGAPLALGANVPAAVHTPRPSADQQVASLIAADDDVREAEQNLSRVGSLLTGAEAQADRFAGLHARAAQSEIARLLRQFWPRAGVSSP
jgi:hypothetical protein